jgi:hypothetical protein
LGYAVVSAARTPAQTVQRKNDPLAMPERSLSAAATTLWRELP